MTQITILNGPMSVRLLPDRPCRTFQMNINASSLQFTGWDQIMADRQPRTLEQILSTAQLPALPQSAIRLLQLSQDVNNGPAEFAVPIEADPGLTGQVLRFINSSYFGFSREISSVKLAITLVGIRTIKNFSLWSAVFSLMPNPKCGSLDVKGLWQDSLRRGLFARALGRQLKLKEQEDLFTAALLQDMAIPLLAKELVLDYAALLDKRQSSPLSLSQLEQQKYGWDHAQAAGIMARKWSLPEYFARLVESHTTPITASTEPGPAIVALSAKLPAGCDLVWREREEFLAAYEQFLDGQEPVQELFARIDQEFSEIAPVLKLSNIIRTLVESLQSEAVAI